MKPVCWHVCLLSAADVGTRPKIICEWSTPLCNTTSQLQFQQAQKISVRERIASFLPVKLWFILQTSSLWTSIWIMVLKKVSDLGEFCCTNIDDEHGILKCKIYCASCHCFPWDGVRRAWNSFVYIRSTPKLIWYIRWSFNWILKHTGVKILYQLLQGRLHEDFSRAIPRWTVNVVLQHC